MKSLRRRNRPKVRFDLLLFLLLSFRTMFCISIHISHRHFPHFVLLKLVTEMDLIWDLWGCVSGVKRIHKTEVAISFVKINK